MRNIIEEIRTEHRNMEQLLKILENQIGIFGAAGQPDYTIVQDIVLYFLDFPDQCHHPKEDLLAQKLLERSPEGKEFLRELPEIHEELGLLIRNMAKLMRRVLDEAELSREYVIRAVEAFINSQRQHIKMEEAHFLPLAEEMLSAADLEELESEIFQRRDPLFAPKIEAHYAMLQDHILAWQERNG